MSEYNLFAGVNEDYEFPPEVRAALLTSLNIRNVGAPMTTAQRNALDTGTLDPGYYIFNTNKQNYQVWRSDFEEWHDGLETPGTQMWWPGDVLPAGWKKQDGAALPRTTYFALFGVIKTIYGGAGSPTHFNLPTTLGRMPVDVGAGFALNQKGGETAVRLSYGQMPKHQAYGSVDNTYTEHSHNGNTAGAGNHTHGYWWITDGTTNTQNEGGNAKYNAARTFTGTGEAGWHGHSFTTDPTGENHSHTYTSNIMGNDEPHENMPPYSGGHFIIKY